MEEIGYELHASLRDNMGQDSMLREYMKQE
jgi:hypothetical protein